MCRTPRIGFHLDLRLVWFGGVLLVLVNVSALVVRLSVRLVSYPTCRVQAGSAAGSGD